MRRSLAVSAFCLAAAIALAGPSATVAQQAAAPSPAQDSIARSELDSAITAIMAEWRVPGLAIGVVRDGQAVLLAGYGYRDLDNALPVTPRTLFAIGSVTKSFTVTVLEMLADAGKLDWEKPVRSYLPDFQLEDEVASQRLTPRDLVTHRSGLPRHDLLWYGSPLSRRELYERLRYLKPSWDIRSTFQYQNLMFMTAGYLAGQLAGSSWEDLVRARVFEPLGMARSNFSVSEMQRSDDFAYPYASSDTVVRQVGYRNLDAIGPAGSINSSVEEMVNYLQFHIDRGRFGDTVLLSEGRAVEMQAPWMAMPGPLRYEEIGDASYGLGFFVSTYRGRKIVSHGGGIDGFVSQFSFMPWEKIGVVVLTNLSGDNPVPTIVTRTVYDRLLGLEPVDWVARVKEQSAEEEKREAERKQKERESRVAGTKPSHALRDYVGRYEHPAYGVISTEAAGPDLRVIYNAWTGVLDHVHYDVFEIREDPLLPIGGTQLLFQYNRQGQIDRLLVPLDPALDDIVFRRVAADSAAAAPEGGRGGGR
jgi:CubicO group peptidase (beta-lactamase class C family)